MEKSWSWLGDLLSSIFAVVARNWDFVIIILILWGLGKIFNIELGAASKKKKK